MFGVIALTSSYEGCKSLTTLPPVQCHIVVPVMHTSIASGRMKSSCAVLFGQLRC